MKFAARTKKRARIATSQSQIDTLPSRRCSVDDSKLRSACSSELCTPDPEKNNNWRDWAGLDDGPAGLIAERVLAYDVADYVRYRATCRPWRHCCTEPRTHSGLDRRFHPWRWIMLREKLVAPYRRNFFNTSTGECIQVDIPELHDNELLALTPEGLLVLAHKPPCTTTICLLNPLTRHRIKLPPLNTLIPSELHEDMLPENGNLSLDPDFIAWGSGIANDDSTVVLCLNSLDMLGIAKPNDDEWTLVDYKGYRLTAPIMFEGRFYCFSPIGVMVLKTGPPRLEVAAKLKKGLNERVESFHLVNNCGDLMLVHRRIVVWSSVLEAKNEVVRRYNAYRVDLDNRMVRRIKSMGGRAVFMGMCCSLSMSLDVFPFGSITSNTIYLSSDVDLRDRAYHLKDGSRTRRYKGSLVPRPHTLVDCLSLSVTL